jgi:hypothetical protein
LVLRLKCFCRQECVKALKDSKISVLILNHQNISSSFEVTSVEWDHKNEYVLEVPVQTYLKNITINVSAKVDMYSGKPA